INHKALFWWGHAAAQNQHDALFYLSWMYEKGYGVPKSLKKSVESYIQASSQGRTPPWEKELNYYSFSSSSSYEEIILGCWNHIRGKPKKAIKYYTIFPPINVPDAYRVSSILAENPPISRLKLNLRKIDEIGIKYIVNSLTSNTVLTQLDLSYSY